MELLRRGELGPLLAFFSVHDPHQFKENILAFYLNYLLSQTLWNGFFRLQVCGAKVLVFSINLTCIPWLAVEMWPKPLCHTHVEYRSP